MGKAFIQIDAVIYSAMKAVPVKVGQGRVRTSPKNANPVSYACRIEKHTQCFKLSCKCTFCNHPS